MNQNEVTIEELESKAKLYNKPIEHKKITIVDNTHKALPAPKVKNEFALKPSERIMQLEIEVADLNVEVEDLKERIQELEDTIWKVLRNEEVF